MSFTPNHQHIVDVASNRKPARLPLYEHIISAETMSAILGVEMRPPGAGDPDGAFDSFYRDYCRFWAEMTYDTVSFEGGVCDVLPGHGALSGRRPGPIQSWDDFEAYPWDELPRMHWEAWYRHYAALARHMPAGMKAIGGVGNGVFEISEDLVGYEPLCLMMYDDPDLVAAVYERIGDLLVAAWTRVLGEYGDVFCVGRMGDDLGFKTSTLMPPDFIRRYIVPQYRRVIALVHGAGKPFLMHSCGCIFSVMDDLIEAGIDAKHSNEDQIAPYRRWIDDYGQRIGLFGGIDVNVLCLNEPDVVYERVVEMGTQFRSAARGYALGSGNSIPKYVPVEGYRAMVAAAQAIRRREI